MKDLSFTRFFNPQKSMSKYGSGINQHQKRKGKLVWDSYRNGTYIKAIHGDLPK